MFFSFLFINMFLWGSLLLFVVVLLYLLQRMQALSKTSWNHKTTSITNALPLTLIFLLPWLSFQVFSVRSYELLGCSWWLGTASSLRYGLFLFSLGICYNFFAHSTNSPLLNKVGLGFEQILSFWFLQATWFFALQSASFLVIILWLELAGLLAILVLGFCGLTTVSEDEATLAWRGRFNTLAVQRGLLSSLILLLWVNGFATILFVWAWGILSLNGLTLCNYTLYDFTSVQAILTSSLSSLTNLLLGLGILIKFLLPPFQFFIFSFYRLMPLNSFLVYIITYYLGLLLTMFTLLLPPLVSLLGGFSFFLLSTLLLLIITLVGGLNTGVDVRITLAFSTILNLTFLLLSLSI